eukprot:6275942-Alexandrium_andersonii.AAC.1
MSASLVGSEMCIRDSGKTSRPMWSSTSMALPPRIAARTGPGLLASSPACLLYTSDAADDM